MVLIHYVYLSNAFDQKVLALSVTESYKVGVQFLLSDLSLR